MFVTCPKCSARHDTAGRKPDEKITCACGNVVAVPKGSKTTLIVVLVVLALSSVPCLGILAAIAIPNFIRYQQRAKSSEARANVMAIAVAETVAFAENNEYVLAGPIPSVLPTGKPVPFQPDEGFSKLGVRFEKVRYQYQVRSKEGGGITILARGDLDGDGRASEYAIDVDQGVRGQLRETEPFE